MRHDISFSTRSLIVIALIVIVVFFAAIAWAQENENDPEGGRIRAVDPTSSPDDVESQATSDVPVPASPNPEEETIMPPASLVDSNGTDEIGVQPASDTSAQVVTLYKFVAGSSFHPREATTTQSYGGSGCVYKTSSSGYLVADLQLPQGAEIDLVSLYFYDSSTNDSAETWFYAYDGLGGFTELAHAASIGSPGRNSVHSALFSHTVDNSSESLGLVVGTASANNSSVQICGVRVRYNVEVPSYVLLPAVLKDYAGK